MPPSFQLAVVLLIAVVAHTNASCDLQVGFNISSMPPSHLPVSFSTTAQDCCTECASNNGCVVAVWYSYFCHMLNTTNGILPLKETQGYTVVFNLEATTTTTTTTTTPAPTTTTTTTAAPTTTTTVPPSTTTAAPTTPAPTRIAPPPALGVIRMVSCEYSSTCSRKEDNTCTTQVFYNDSCLVNTGVRYICGNNTIAKAHYENTTYCTNFERSTESAANECFMNQNDEYQGTYCDAYDDYPTPGVSLKRTLCPLGCDDGGECRKAEFTTGVCLTHNPFQTILGGNSVIAWCYPDYVVYLGFQGSDCGGEFVSSASEPIGKQCFLDQNEDHIQNLCG
ncbi:Hypothetical protein, putative [Bodo saltans]|uniref:Membrane-associated protein n=1 Tax=Bodo saltans TaxID=75058 RepID=A0A0S4J6U2_BODSA|nr:Hypothetical protein, putative [Bodo saltans]|eukprot:CUG86935.1 Hypothetical protein, putative [Bodo saltans]